MSDLLSSALLAGSHRQVHAAEEESTHPSLPQIWLLTSLLDTEKTLAVIKQDSDKVQLGV